ncbi:biotin--[acetyl-CoA-carboxylase] ligase [uncultured Pseudokineococcus sp.]|uniref:biotin--[acetyl-CoA-carboxylase] ligase n=1 Tax=uncultured Pseudokineococcus sp. TaxID=1642928 RepID=UPI0026122233|nr:biotin--[acetyl-CoA-carboxylase] ligase [uncultured Pseudokineococcus sp.]
MSSPGPWADLARPPLRGAALRSALVRPAGPLGRLEVEAALDSTSTVLAERVRAEPGGWPDLSVLVAEHQVQGRGRRGRSFTTAPRAALTASVLLRAPAGSAPSLPWLPLLTGLAVVEVLRRRAGLQAVLKWPNDVLVPPPPRPSTAPTSAAAPAASGPAKVCGVLAEVLPPGAAASDEGPVVVVGVGLNVDARADELPAAGATSLRLAGAATTDRDVLLRALLRRLADHWQRWGAAAAGGGPLPAGLTDPVREVCSTLGERVRVELPGGALLEGVAESLDASGALVVRTADGARAVTAGDVVHLRPAGGATAPDGGRG